LAPDRLERSVFLGGLGGVILFGLGGIVLADFNGRIRQLNIHRARLGIGGPFLAFLNDRSAFRGGGFLGFAAGSQREGKSEQGQGKLLYGVDSSVCAQE
jgi:hypothetical protein